MCFSYAPQLIFKTMLALKTQNKSPKWLNNVRTEWLVNGTTLQITISNAKSSPVNNGNALLDLASENQMVPNLYDMQPLFLYEMEETTTVILAPMYGGIWTLCTSLTGTLYYWQSRIAYYNMIYFRF